MLAVYGCHGRTENTTWPAQKQRVDQLHSQRRGHRGKRKKESVSPSALGIGRDLGCCPLAPPPSHSRSGLRNRRYTSGKGNHSRNKTHSPAVVNTGFRVKSRRYPDSLLPLNSLRGLASTTLPASAPSSTELSTLALQGCCTVRFHTALNTGPHSRKRL